MQFKPKSGLFFVPDTGNVTGAGAGQNDQAGQQKGGDGEQAVGNENTAKDEFKSKPVTSESEEALQAHIDAIIKDRLKRAREKSDRDAEDARKKAEQDVLAKNAEWQKLAEQCGTEIDGLKTELTGSQEKAGRFEKALQAQLDAAKKDLPAAVLTLLDKLDPVEQLEWIAENAGEILTTQKPSKNGVPETQRPLC